MRTIAFVFTAIVLASCQPCFAQQDLAFQLSDIDGNIVQLEVQTDSKLTVVCFLGTECPLAKLYATKLTEMRTTFADVNFIGVCSNRQDSVEELVAFRDQHEISFPIVKDPNNIVADQFQAQRTPEVFLVNQDLQILYRGRIDDQYQPGLGRASSTRDDLRIAINESLSGDEISVPTTEPYGCLIGRVKNETDANSAVTFSNQISRLLQNHCSECHEDGEIGPMSLTDYDEVVGWADMIVEVVADNRMPPWHADPKHGKFVNERRMTEAEKQMLKDWVAAGTPEGEKSQLPPEPPLVASSEWRLPREPDAIFEMRSKPFTVPKVGTVEYQYFVVDPNFEEDKWITAAEIIPGERSVLHHSIVFVRPPDGEGMQGIGWLAAYVPGQSAPAYNPKFGRRIPKGSKLVFQQHYTPTGYEREDITRVGLIFGDEKEIENEVFTLLALDQELVIPPDTAEHVVDKEFDWIPARGSLHGFSPHMHYRGKSFELTAKRNNKMETLLSVPNYDFNWQHIYQLQEPIPLEELQSLQFKATFNNSGSNPSNPDPSQTVTWGDQTWEEMAVVFAIVSQPRTPVSSAIRQATDEEIAAAQARQNTAFERATKFTDDFFDRFDANNDSFVGSSELPRSTRNFGLWRLDQNRDQILSRDEIMDKAIRKFGG